MTIIIKIKIAGLFYLCPFLITQINRTNVHARFNPMKFPLHKLTRKMEKKSIFKVTNTPPRNSLDYISGPQHDTDAHFCEQGKLPLPCNHLEALQCKTKSAMPRFLRLISTTSIKSITRQLAMLSN
uniref:Putative ovule protein n=1 Tax=Solanum chacoense TaxID=4108 RepID=A0A0V0HNW8_SOLCH